MSSLTKEAAYDSVGRYSQDQVNGFSKSLLERFAEAADLSNATSVLDAMAGDGNLTALLHRYCHQKGIAYPEVTTLEVSRVQLEFARAELRLVPGKLIWGDATSMTSMEDGKAISECSFDRVLIKSGNHEISKAQQPGFYSNIYRVLRAGGLYVNLGFLFDDAKERDEFREIARCKDSLAGMKAAVLNRHFLTRSEYYSILRDAGFVDIRCAEKIDYSIQSAVVAEQYFSKLGTSAATEFLSSQRRASTLVQNGRIRFDGDNSQMTIPGEITVARRPTWAESNAQAFRHCPYDFLRHLECHRELLSRTLRQVPNGARVIDLGSGPGLLAERLISRISEYRGYEISPEFVQKCRERYGVVPGFTFSEADIMKADIGREWADVVSILNVIYLPGIDPAVVLRKAFDAIRPGGCLVISGPTSQESYRRAEPKMRAQLEKDGLLEQYEPFFRAVGEANARLLPGQGNYWAAEGMAALLRTIGFKKVRVVESDLYYGFAFLVVAEK